MTFSSSCAPLTGISRARLPAWALPDGWPTQANGEPLLADLAFRDGRIAALTPTDQPTPGLWDLAGALTLPGLVEPHAHLDKTFTIERCRPAQAGLLPAIHAMHEDRRHWTRADIQRRASAALARAAANGVTHLRSHIDWFTADAPDAWQEIARLDTGGITLERVALVPLPCFRIRRMPRPLPVRSPTAGSAACWAASSTPPTGTPPPWQTCCIAQPAGNWIWICISMRSSARCLRG
jgi:cytosine deaminase